MAAPASNREIIEGIANEIDFRNIPLMQTAVLREGEYHITSNPTVPTRNQPLTFEFKGDPYSYINLNRSYFVFRMRVTPK
jgi:hypothetical protein